MLRVARFACCVVLLVLLSAGSCGDDPPRPGGSGSSPSSTPATSVSTSATTAETTSASATPTVTATDRTSVTAMRTGSTVTKDNQPIDAAGLLAIGWTVDAAAGTAHWSDPTLGEISVTWETPAASIIANADLDFWADVTAQNTATNPSMSTSVFTGGPTEVSAHAVNGETARSPTGRLRLTVPEQPVGTVASISINLGFPVPVLVTYNYVYI